MNNKEYIQTRTVYVSARPERIAVLTDSNDMNWKQNCLEIIKAYSNMWGGAYNIIIPTDGNKIDKLFLNFLKHYDPDFIYSFDNLKINCELNKVMQKELNPFPDFEGKHIHFMANADFLLHFPHTPLWEALPPFSESEIYAIQYFGIDSEDLDLKLLLYAFAGYGLENLHSRAQNSYGKTYDPSKFFQVVKANSFNEENIHEFFQFIENPNNKTFFNATLEANLNFALRKKHLVKRKCKRIICGNSINDFCYFYNFNRGNKNVLWIPWDIDSKNWKNLKSIYGYIPRITIDYDSNLYFYSFTFSGEGISNINDSTNSEFLSEFNDLIDIDSYQIDRRMLFLQGKSQERIDTPFPSGFYPKKFARHREKEFYNHRWITEVEIEDYKVPQKKELISNILTEAGDPITNTRISPNGFCYQCPHIAHFARAVHRQIYRPFVRIISPFEIFKLIFENHGISIRPSDKGNYQREAIKMLGSLEETNEILHKFRSIFDLFTDESKNEEGEYTKGVFTNKRRYLDWNSLSTIKEINENDLNYFIELGLKKGFLLRGHVLKCDLCKDASWYLATEVSNQFTCKRCGNANFINSNALYLQSSRNEPKTYYNLYEIFSLGYMQGMLVPITTLNYLKNKYEESNNRDCFLYIEEIELQKNGIKSELDIMCIKNGKIIIGESTSKDNLNRDREGEKARIGKIIKLAKLINPHKLVMSTLNEKWSEKTQNLVKEICEGSDYPIENVLYLTEKDLQ